MAYNPGGGSGSVTSVSVVTANGVSASVANASSTPALTFTLGAITPSTVNGVTISGSGSPTLAVTGTSSISGANTGDQTNVSGSSGSCTGNAATATKFAASVTINGTAFDGSSNIVVSATPTAHASTHENGGTDAIKIGTLRTTTTDITVAADYSVVISCCYEVGSGFVTELSTDATLEVL